MPSTVQGRWRLPAAAVAAGALALSGVAISPAHAGPAEGPESCTLPNPVPDPPPAERELTITSSTTTSVGQELFYLGVGFPAGTTISIKIDDRCYVGSNVIDTARVEGDGSFSGSFVVPADIDDPVGGTEAAPTGNENADGPHWLRALTAGVSHWSQDFEVTADATAAPEMTATAVAASGRGGATVTVTVAGSGFVPNESVTVLEAASETALKWTVGSGRTATTVDAIQADAGGNLSGTIVVPAGDVLKAGEHQLLFPRSEAPDKPAVAQVSVGAIVAVTGAALASNGTVSVTNAQPGAVFDKVTFDPNPSVTGDDVTVTSGALTADASGTATGTIRIPDGPANLGTKTFTASQTTPYAASYTGSAKISPSTATFGQDKFTVIKSADGAIRDGLYQTAYNEKTNALYATTAYQTDGQWDGTLYKLNPATLAVVDSERAPVADEATGARYAPYGVGVDSDHNTVWVTNTRQNTVTVYDGATLNVLATNLGTVSHSRDVIYDPGTGQVYVTSASEGTSGDGYISVFEADDKDGDGTKYEHITDIETGPRTDYSPMSLELDVASHTLFSPSLSSQKIAKINTLDNTFTFLTVDGILASGRGASGIAYDKVTNRIFVASQNTDELVIADATTGATLHEIPTGAGALNVAFDPVKRLAYVANFGGSTITVVDPNGNKVANLPYPRTNHLHEDGKGNVFAVDKNAGNHVWKLSLKPANPGGNTGGNAGNDDGGSTTPALSPLQKKVAKAQAKVKADKAKIKAIKAKIKKAKKAHKAKVAKKLKKQLTKAQKKLKKDKKQLTKLKKKLKKSKAKSKR